MLIAAANLKMPRVNPDWAKLPLFDRTGWTKVRFGEVVENLNETERDPGASGIERFIGLEHLEPGSLHVRTWGNVADGTTFTRRCRPGQVLFGKRRAYQRKVAVAEFDAVVSGDIYVLAPKVAPASSRCSAKDLRQDAGARLLPELLPFLCLSERFFRHAVGTSAGSLSPRTNWNSLASFEFDLPPLDQQQGILGLLGGVNTTLERHQNLLAAIENHRRASIVHLYERGTGEGPLKDTSLGPRPLHWQVLPLEENYEVQLGKKLYERERRGPTPRPYMRNANVRWNALDLTEVDMMSFSPEEAAKYELRSGDILACEGRHVGKSAIWRNEIPGACYQMALHRIRAKNDEQVPEFLLHHMIYSSWRGLFHEGTGTTTIPHLPAERLKCIPFAFPPTWEQRQIAECVATIDLAAAAANAHLAATTSVLSALTEQILFYGA